MGYSWSIYNKLSADLHGFLVKDVQNVQVVESKHFTMYFITAQHIEAMKKFNHSINYDQLRYGRYSNILNDRFGAVYSENLDKMCPANELYTNCSYKYKAKKQEKKVKNKKKKKKKENAGPPHQQRQPYSKQNSKNKAKAQEKKLEKNWDTAKAEIIKWPK